MNYGTAALRYLDDQVDQLEHQVKDEALCIAGCRGEKLVTEEIMREAFVIVVKRFVD